MVLENGSDKCICRKISCPRHGDCKACIEHHTINTKYLPYCRRKISGMNIKEITEITEIKDIKKQKILKTEGTTVKERNV